MGDFVGMNVPIASIRGLEDEVREKLQAVGITDTQHLLEQARTEKQRRELANRTGTTPHVIKEAVNRADLLRLRGIGESFSNLLEEAGVNSCKELQHRIPEHLFQTLKELQASTKIAHHAPTLAEVTEWVAAAKTFAATSPE